MTYFVLVICNAVGMCREVSTMVEPGYGTSPAYACMMNGQIEAKKYLEDHPGWYARRWSCGGRPPAQSL